MSLNVPCCQLLVSLGRRYASRNQKSTRPAPELPHSPSDNRARETSLYDGVGISTVVCTCHKSQEAVGRVKLLARRNVQLGLEFDLLFGQLLSSQSCFSAPENVQNCAVDLERRK